VKQAEKPRVVVHVEQLEEAPAVVAEAHQALRQEEGRYFTLRIWLTPEEENLVRTVMGWMLYDPELLESRTRVSYANAFRYSLRRCVAHPPAHAEVAGG